VIENLKKEEENVDINKLVHKSPSKMDRNRVHSMPEGALTSFTVRDAYRCSAGQR